MIKKITALVLCFAMTAVLISCSKGAETAKADKEPLVFDAFDLTYSSYDSGTVSAFGNLCKAVYNGESEVRFNLGMFDGVIQLFYTSYPLSVLVKNIEKKSDGSGVTVTYKTDADDVIAKSKAFSNRVNSILSDCGYGKVNEKALAVKIYSYVTNSVKNSSKDGLTVYDTIMTGEGDSYTCSNMLEYLFRQGGIKSAHIIASDVSKAGWGITLAEFDGEGYLFDPMTEIHANGGKQLCYFGMTTEDAAAEGLVEFVYTNRQKAAVCDNPFFDACRSCRSWEFGEDNASLLITRYDGEIVEIAL
ncbi:MAG: hypothetical protein E7571_07565 [Ruminococcaceae bacterium]|nr:hypothetical protein [Oscillospiraceae bacterium]